MSSTTENRQELFAEYYIQTNFNGTEAAIKAGYAKSGAGVQANRLLKNANIQQLVKEKIRQKLGDVEQLSMRWLNRVLEIAFSEPRVQYNKSGDFLGYDYTDQRGALDLLGKFLSLYSEHRIINTETEREKMDRETRRRKIVELTNKLYGEK